MSTRPRRRRRLKSITPEERLVVGLASALAAIGALAAGAHPTPHLVSDVVLTAGFAVAVTLAASVARTWAWVVLASTAAVATGGEYPVAAIAVELYALIATVVDVPLRRMFGAFVGASAVQLLLRMGPGPFLGSTALVALLATVPTFVTAWPLLRRATRRTVRRVAWIGGAVVLAGVVLAGVSLLQARSATSEAVDHIRRGLDAARAGDTRVAADELAAAANAFDTAHRDASAWWARPSELVPIVGQQVHSVTRLTSAGQAAAAASAKATLEADVEDLRVRGGRIDVAKLAATAQPLADVQAALTRLAGEVGAARNPWLVAPLADRIARVDEEVRLARSDTDLASDVVAVAPSLLGGRGARHYFVAFGNPAESRDLGGFAGGYGELVVDNGSLHLERVGQASDLNAGGPHPLTNPDALPARFRTFKLEQFWQNVTSSPDFPTVAEAVRQLWPESGGGQLDGALYVDPSALAAMLRLTGPVQVEGLDTPLSTDNVVQFLTHDQYLDPKLGADRHDHLSDAAKTVFDKLTSIDLPGPRAMADTLGPPAHGGHLWVRSYHEDEQALMARLGIDGAMPTGPGDVLVVTASNRGQNKIDAFLTRSTDDHVTVDPSTGHVEATVRVTLRNDAPAEGLPRILIGNDIGLPSGTNSVVVSVSTGLSLDAASIDGADASPGFRREYGHFTYSTEVVIPPSGSRVLELKLHGTIPARQAYDLAVLPRPNVGDDHLSIHIEAAKGWRITSSEKLDPGGASDQAVTRREDFRVTFGNL